MLLAATGMTDDEIARRLGTSRRDVERDLAGVCERLGLHDRAALIVATCTTEERAEP